MRWHNTSYANDAPIQQDKFWTEHLLKHQPDLKERVERTVSQWNNSIRDLIRNETGLRLNISNGGTTTAQIKVVDGVSQPLAEVLRQYQQYADLLLHEPLIQATVQGLEFVQKNYDAFYELTPESPVGKMPYEPEEIYYTSSWLKTTLEELQKLNFKQALTRIEEDALGAYFLGRNRIEIYWVAVGIYAAQLNVSVEGLTLVTLIHELAHAYTHLGKDIDGIEWNTEAFAATDLHIVEGLAQFYTRAICRKLEQRIPSALQAFETLLEHQSPVYRDFQGWAEQSRHQGEMVRFAMIQCRTVSMTEYGDFLHTLKASRV